MVKNKAGAKWKNRSGRVSIFAGGKIQFSLKKNLGTFVLNLTLYTCCMCVKIDFSSYQDLFLVTYPTGLNCRRIHSLLVPVASPMVELDPSLFSLKKVLKSDKGPPAYNASGR